MAETGVPSASMGASPSHPAPCLPLPVFICVPGACALLPLSCGDAITGF